VKKASSVVQYGILLAVVVLALAGISYRVRKTIQGRVKAFSDTVIGEDRTATESGKTVTKETKILSDSRTRSETNDGGSVTIDNHTIRDLDFERTNSASSGGGSLAERDLLIDYARKPPQLDYPNVEYREWDLKWDLE